MANELIDIAIIGGGPAGMTAAVYASRAEKKTVMFEKDAPGGKLIKTAEIENWPGVKHSTGPDLAVSMFEHATAFGAEYRYGDIVDIKDNGKTKTLIMADGTQVDAKAVIVATGMKEKKIGIPGEDDLYGNGISYCAVCDGALYKGRDILVIGGGNSALEEGVYLTQFASKLYVMYRREEFFRAEQTHVTKIKNNPKAETIMSANPISFKKDGEDVLVTYEQNGEQKEIKVGCVFPMIGQDYVTDFMKSTTKDTGPITTDEAMSTKIKGIFAAGDVRNKKIRQVTTAVSDGTIAAQEAIEYVNNLK